MDIKFSLSFVDKNGKILSMIFDMQILANDFNNSFRTVYEGDRRILLSNGAIIATHPNIDFVTKKLQILIKMHKILMKLQLLKF